MQAAFDLFTTELGVTEELYDVFEAFALGISALQWRQLGRIQRNSSRKTEELEFKRVLGVDNRSGDRGFELIRDLTRPPIVPRRANYSSGKL